LYARPADYLSLTSWVVLSSAGPSSPVLSNLSTSARFALTTLTVANVGNTSNKVELFGFQPSSGQSCFSTTGSSLGTYTSVFVPAASTQHLAYPLPLISRPTSPPSAPWCIKVQASGVAAGTRLEVTVVGYRV